MATKKKQEVPEYTKGGNRRVRGPEVVQEDGKLPEVKIESRPLTDEEAKELEKAIADSPVMAKGGLEAEFEKEYGWIAPNNVAGLYKAMLKELFFIRKGIENGK